MSQTEECLKKRILAVDDDIIVLTRISSILRNFGFIKYNIKLCHYQTTFHFQLQQELL